MKQSKNQVWAKGHIYTEKIGHEGIQHIRQTMTLLKGLSWSDGLQESRGSSVTKTPSVGSPLSEHKWRIWDHNAITLKCAGGKGSELG